MVAQYGSNMFRQATACSEWSWCVLDPPSSGWHNRKWGCAMVTGSRCRLPAAMCIKSQRIEDIKLVYEWRFGSIDIPQQILWDTNNSKHDISNISDISHSWVTCRIRRWEGIKICPSCGKIMCPSKDNKVLGRWKPTTITTRKNHTQTWWSCTSYIKIEGKHAQLQTKSHIFCGYFF